MVQSLTEKSSWRPFRVSEYVLVCYSLLMNVHCLIICMHLSVLSKKLVIFIMHRMNLMSCFLINVFTMWVFKIPHRFCVNDLFIKMICFVIFSLSLFFHRFFRICIRHYHKATRNI